MGGIILGSALLTINIMIFIYDRINYHWSGYDKDLNGFNIPSICLSIFIILLGIIDILK